MERIISIYVIVMILLLCEQASQVLRTENDGEIFEVIVDKPAKLTCKFSTNELDDTWIRWWYIDGDKLAADNVDVQLKGYRISTNGSIGILDIDSATDNFAGKYRCYIIHRNFDQIGVVTLELLYPPTNLSFNDSSDGHIEVQNGVPSQLVCRAVGAKPRPKFRFKSDDIAIIVSEETSTCDADDICKSVVNITANVEDDGKEITCIVNTITTTVTIDVIVPISQETLLIMAYGKLKAIQEETFSVMEKEPIFLRCLANATRPKVNLRIKINGTDFNTTATTMKGNDGLLSTVSEVLYMPTKENDADRLCCLATQRYRRRQAKNVEICKTLKVEDYLAPETNETPYEEQEITNTSNFTMLEQPADGAIHKQSTDLTTIEVLKSWIETNLPIAITTPTIILFLICLTCILIRAKKRKVKETSKKIVYMDYKPDDNEYADLKISAKIPDFDHVYDYII